MPRSKNPLDPASPIQRFGASVSALQNLANQSRTTHKHREKRAEVTEEKKEKSDRPC